MPSIPHFARVAMVLFAVACWANLMVTDLIEDRSPRGEIFGFFLTGFLVCEFALLGLLLASWKAHLVQRLSTVALMLVVLVACWVIPLTNFGDDPIPVFILSVVYLIAAAGISVFWGSFAFIRYRLRKSREGVRLPHRDASVGFVSDGASQANLPKTNHQSRYGIGFLLVMMVGVAIAIVLHQNIVSTKREFIDDPELYQVLFVAFAYTLLTVYSFVTVFVAAGLTRNRSWIVAHFAGTLGLMSAWYIFAISFFGPSFFENDGFFAFCCFFFGVSLSGWIAFVVLRLNGFQAVEVEAPRQKIPEGFSSLTPTAATLAPVSHDEDSASMDPQESLQRKRASEWDVD